jgi:hypothetical protein
MYDNQNFHRSIPCELLLSCTRRSRQNIMLIDIIIFIHIILIVFKQKW